MSVSDIRFEDGDDLVVGFLAVNHAESADGTRADEEVAVRESLFRQHANVHRVAVALDAFDADALAAEFTHEVAAESLRNEPVERRAET